jgi:hypothetical protein
LPRLPQPTALSSFTDHVLLVLQSETLTWIYAEQTRVLFFARGPASEIPASQTHFDQIIYSAVVP